MSTIDVNLDEFYADSIREQIAELKEELAQLEKIAKDSGLSRFEFRALERNLQLLVEIAIGMAKRVLKSASKEVPSDSRKAFEKLKQYDLDSTVVDWPKAIGMRNALVHDYLSVDGQIITSVLTDGYYQQIFEFFDQYL